MHTLDERVSGKLITTLPVGLFSPSILHVIRREANAPSFNAVSDTISAGSVSSVETSSMMPVTERVPDLDLSVPFLPVFDHDSVTEMVLPFHLVICSSTVFCFGDVQCMSPERSPSEALPRLLYRQHMTASCLTGSAVYLSLWQYRSLNP